MSASHQPVLDRDGNCEICGRPTANYGDGPQHRRGRVAGQSRFRIPTRAELARMSIEECVAAGFCDCGLRLEGHPELPKPKPLMSGQAQRARLFSAEHIDKLIAARTAASQAFGTQPITRRMEGWVA